MRRVVDPPHVCYLEALRFTDGMDLPGAGTYLMDGYLVVVSDVIPGHVERWFSDPEVATDTIMGARSAQVLLDRDGYFPGIQARAQAFVWDQAMQELANQHAHVRGQCLIRRIDPGDGSAVGMGPIASHSIWYRERRRASPDAQ